jgi:hypothetical protein
MDDEETVAQFEEDPRLARALQISEWGWRLAIFLAGVTMTLIGSIYTNGASKKDIADAMNANNQVVSLQLQTLSDSQKSLLTKMEKLEDQVQRLNVAMGTDDNAEYRGGKPYVRRK